MADTSLNQKVVDFAKRLLKAKQGARVDGHKEAQCWDLPEEALVHSGARSSRDYMEVAGTREEDYVWGDKIEPPTEVQPGDILQLRNHVVTRTLRSKGTLTCPDGKTVTIDSSLERKFTRAPQHSAIVSSTYDKNNKSVKVFEQHVYKKAYVQENQVYLGPSDSSENRSETFKCADVAQMNKLRGNFASEPKILIHIRSSLRKCKNGIFKLELTNTTGVRIAEDATVWAYRPKAK